MGCLFIVEGQPFLFSEVVSSRPLTLPYSNKKNAILIWTAFSFFELLMRIELTDADAPVGLYLHSS